MAAYYNFDRAFIDRYIPPPISGYEATIDGSTTGGSPRLPRRVRLWTGFTTAAKAHQFPDARNFPFIPETSRAVLNEDGVCWYVLRNVVDPCTKFFRSAVDPPFDANFGRFRTNGCEPDSQLFVIEDGERRVTGFIEVKKYQTLSVGTADDHGRLDIWFKGGRNSGAVPTCIDQVIGQVYGYLLANRYQTGVLTTYERTWFLHLDPNDDAVMWATPPIARTATEPTLTRCMLFWMHRLLSDNPGDENIFNSTFDADSIHCGPGSDDECYHDAETSFEPPSSDFDQHSNFSDNHVSSSSDSEDIKINQILDAMALTRPWPNDVIGQGACGVVVQFKYRGHALALKTADFHNHKRGYKMLKNEMAVYERLKPLQGRLIPNCFGLGKIYAVAVLALSFIDADPFDRAIHDEESVKVQLDSAIEEIRRLGVDHNDVKPANTLVERATGRVWVIDFSHATISPSAL